MKPIFDLYVYLYVVTPPAKSKSKGLYLSVPLMKYHVFDDFDYERGLKHYCYSLGSLKQLYFQVLPIVP